MFVPGGTGHGLWERSGRRGERCRNGERGTKKDEVGYQECGH